MWKAALALVVLSALAGCQKPESANTPSEPGASAGTKLKVVYIPKNTGNPYFNEEINGFKEACGELGADFFTTAPPTADATAQIPYIKEQVQRKVDVLAITPNSPDALNSVVDEAKSKGITVVTVDADLDGNESHREAAVLPTDFSKIGESQVELLGKQIGYAGPIAILSATSNAPNQNAWIASMKEVLKQPKYAKMQLVDVVYGDDEPEKSTTEFQALLSKHPDLRGVIAPTSVGLAAAAQALEIAGVYPGGPKANGPGLVLTGLSTPNQMKRFVDKGVVQSFQLWNPKDMGYIACLLSEQIHSGKLKPAEGTSFKAGKLGDRTFGPKNVVLAGPLLTFDKTNIAQFNF